MADEVRVWEVGRDDLLAEVRSSKLNLEQRIETWVKKDISLLDPGLLVIGEQVKTDFGKYIDLLCIDSDGNLAIIELKRDRTPREVTAQALDYASWVKDLDADNVREIATEYFGGTRTLEEAFEQKFETDLSEVVINDHHSMKIVASEIDDGTERIIRYLSENHGVDINAVRFHVFRSQDGRELVVRTFTVAPEEAEQNTARIGRSRRTSPTKTLEVRLEESVNPFEKAFIQERLNAGQRTNKRKTVLAYPASGTIRWYVRPRRDRANVIQKGRFLGDEEYWQQHLSNRSLAYRRKGSDLGFNLYTKEDFDFFQGTMNNQASGFDWRASAHDVLEDERED